MTRAHAPRQVDSDGDGCARYTALGACATPPAQLRAYAVDGVDATQARRSL
jgi:hypothetical protein